MEWFRDGERNTKLFHTMVKGRRARLMIEHIQNNEEVWMDSQEEISKVAKEFYQK